MTLALTLAGLTIAGLVWLLLHQSRQAGQTDANLKAERKGHENDRQILEKRQNVRQNIECLDDDAVRRRLHRWVRKP